MIEVKLAIKLRDAHQVIADTWNGYLKDETQNQWNPEKVKWQPATGAKGHYEKAEPQATADFKAMILDLQAHGGKLTRRGRFYWIFSDSATVGRKQLQE